MSPRGRDVQFRYRVSPKGIVARTAYDKSVLGQARYHRADKSPAGVDRIWRKRQRLKEKRKELRYASPT